MPAGKGTRAQLISRCTIILCAASLLVGASDRATQAAPRTVSAPLDIAEVARNASVALKPAQRPRRKVADRPPKAPASAGAATTVAPEDDAGDVTGAIGSKKTSKAAKSGAATTNVSDGTQFCSNIADAASDARLAWQMKELEKVEASLRERIAELEAKRAEYEAWLKLRQDFLKKAEDSVVGIYSRMRPDAAAAQIASMQDDTAAAVLAKLNTRSSSAILNEMEPARAAHLANTLSGLRQTESEKSTK
jgi:flagellar motility protein MotE (MotC chaperone)